MTATKVKMPGGIRAKLMSAIAMLLVASILMVSTTYAWFTLSTAPEVTGITTSVGANGNLEIALLNTNTYAHTDQITSAVGDSSANQAGTAANVTWGNLVDLSDASYGLNEIALMPAELNVTGGTLGAAPLKTPAYGADGRVSGLVDNNTASAIKGTDGWTIYNGNQDYGVRAVGSSSGLSTRQVALTAAKKNVSIKLSQATATIESAIGANVGGLLAFAQANDTTVISAAQAESIYNLAVAVQTSVNSIDSAYRQVAVAVAAASGSVTEEQFNALTGTINTLALTDLSTYASSYGTDFTKIAKMVADANAAVSNLNALRTGGNGTQFKQAAGAILSGDTCNVEGMNATIKNSTSATSLLGDIADYAGGYAYTIAGVGGVTATPLTDKAAAVKGVVNALTASGATASGNQTLDNLYGYIVDFAFRTNAASSNLQLQTDGVQRVYNDSLSDATQGAGSTLTFTLQNGMTSEQAAAFVKAARVVFFDPDTNLVYATAAAGTVSNVGNGVKAPLYLIDTITKVENVTINLGRDAYTGPNGNGDYVLNTAGYPVAGVTVGNGVKTVTSYTNYALTVTAANYAKLPTATTTYKTTDESYTLHNDKTAITALTQNVVHKISALVYIDGNLIDNGDTVNAEVSGAMSLNLQFSSSAKLIPMENTALKGLESSVVKASGLTITENSKKLTATLTGEGNNENIASTVWTSSDTSVATVAADGTVNEHQNGETTITALVKTDKGNIYSATRLWAVTTPTTGASIMKDGNAVSDFTLALSGSKTLKNSAALSLKLDPNNTTDVLDDSKTITWDSADTTKVSVSNTGEVNAVTVTGASPVAVKATYFVKGVDTPKTATVNVTVVNAATEVTTKVGEDTTDTMTIISRAATKSFVPEVAEGDSIESVVIFGIADETVARGAVNGTNIDVTGLKNGKTTLVAIITTNNGAQFVKEYTVLVNFPKLTANDVTLSPDSVELTMGSTETASITLTNNSTDDSIESVTWTSDSNAVATVSGDTSGATITAVDAGNTTVRAAVKSVNGASFTKTVTVTVNSSGEP